MTGFRDLDVYRVAIEYVQATRPLVLRLRREDQAMANQLHRSVISIPLNTAEGAGEFSPKDKARFYRYGLRSSTETRATLDICQAFGLIPGAEYARCSALADRLIALLTRLARTTAERAANQQEPPRT